MSADHDAAAASYAPTHAPQQVGETEGPQESAPLALSTPSISALLASPHIQRRGNGPVRQAAILQLQRTQGNRATGRWLQRQQMGRVAPSPEAPARDAGAPEGATDDIGARIQARASGGRALEPPVQRALENGLGANLSSVRVHTDSEADQLSRAVDAVAFTTGPDIFFRAGTYNPSSPEGLHLLAHEAAHAVQQAHGPVAGTPQAGGVSVSDPSDSFEQAAEQAATQVLAGSVGAAARTAGAPAAGPAPATAGVSVQRRAAGPVRVQRDTPPDAGPTAWPIPVPAPDAAPVAAPIPAPPPAAAPAGTPTPVKAPATTPPGPPPLAQPPATTSAAPPTPAAPSRFRPPPELYQGRLPGDALVVDVDTRPLNERLKAGTGWLEAIARDQTWRGWEDIDVLTAPDKMNAQLRNATGGGGISHTLTPHHSWSGDIAVRVQISALIHHVTFEAADGVGVTQTSTSSAGVTGQGNVGGGTSLSLPGSVKFGDPKEGGEFSGGPSVGASTSWGEQSGAAWSGGVAAGAAASEGVRFRISILWTVNVWQRSDANPTVSQFAGGAASLAASVDEDVALLTASSEAVIRVPKVRCMPE